MEVPIVDDADDPYHDGVNVSVALPMLDDLKQVDPDGAVRLVLTGRLTASLTADEADNVARALMRAAASLRAAKGGG